MCLERWAAGQGIIVGSSQAASVITQYRSYRVVRPAMARRTGELPGCQARTTPSLLQRSEERDQRGFIVCGEIDSEFVAGHRAVFHFVALEPCGDVVVT
jgi:hypothetical protein